MYFHISYVSFGASNTQFFSHNTTLFQLQESLSGLSKSNRWVKRGTRICKTKRYRKKCQCCGLLPCHYDQFMTTLMLHFGRNPYFKRRRGNILLPPEEQEVVRLMLEEVGADSKMDFNKFEEYVNWDA